MNKRKLTMYCTPETRRKLQALAKQGGCSINYLVETCVAFDPSNRAACARSLRRFTEIAQSEWGSSARVATSQETTLISASLTFGCVPLLQKFEHFFIVEVVSPPTHLGLRFRPDAISRRLQDAGASLQ
jgi:hypothetical protein